jgi:hypothetical protein
MNPFKALFSQGNSFISRRAMALSGHLVAMIIVMKLTWMGGMTEGYFGIYVAFIAAHASAEKMIDRKNNVRAVKSRPTGVRTGDI